MEKRKGRVRSTNKEKNKKFQNAQTKTRKKQKRSFREK